ncbi:MAG: hypothetical protein KDK23_15740, partial [Leptospiraceae bacterium]|nr:hypothetical protein [Leptospiraceae bacterium]
DFMCGSGTIPLEAFMVRNNLPPGIFREMSFENWKIYFAKEHKKVLDQAKGAWKGARAAASASLEVADKEPGAGDNSLRDQALDISEGRKAMIRGSDVSDRSIQVAKNNRKWLKLTADQVFFETLEAAHIQELPASGTAIINPPYGERLSLEDAAAFYKELGDIMKKSFKGWSVWILSSNKEGLKSIGLKAAQKHTLFNGPLECSFRRYDMY